MASMTIIAGIKLDGFVLKKKGGKKDIGIRLGLTGMHSKIAFQIKCTNVQ